MTGRRVDAERAYLEAAEAVGRALDAANTQRKSIEVLERHLANAREVLAELEARVTQAARDENYAYSYAQEVAL